jgi:hypothetical protein
MARRTGLICFQCDGLIPANRSYFNLSKTDTTCSSTPFKNITFCSRACLGRWATRIDGGV